MGENYGLHLHRVEKNFDPILNAEFVIWHSSFLTAQLALLSHL